MRGLPGLHGNHPALRSSPPPGLHPTLHNMHEALSVLVLYAVFTSLIAGLKCFMLGPAENQQSHSGRFSCWRPCSPRSSCLAPRRRSPEPSRRAWCSTSRCSSWWSASTTPSWGARCRASPASRCSRATSSACRPCSPARCQSRARRPPPTRSPRFCWPSEGTSSTGCCCRRSSSARSGWRSCWC
uniref:Cysteine-rich membrane protein 2 n=1 Tax=Spironucleus salmonicida TaxID=348837 RepID=V6LHT0_9EUKA|eukprot:EST44112.1 Cysteine-rich membrane protein 2 [Spironucleus salmonicida]